MTDQIRAATRGDVAAIYALIGEMATFEKLTHLLEVTEDGLASALFGPQPSAEAIVTERAGEVVAYALFFHNFSTFVGRRGLYLEDLYVKQELRGQGLGKALLRKLAALAVERQCGRFEWTVLDWNRSAIDFYEAMGATVLPDWRVVRIAGDKLRQLAAPA
jgi:GNAT superfamily N-acetyltransferase